MLDRDFRLRLRHEKYHNLLNFQDAGIPFWIFMGFENHVFELKLSEQFFNDPGGIGFKIFGFSKNNSLAKQSMVLTNPYFQEQLFCVL